MSCLDFASPIPPQTSVDSKILLFAKFRSFNRIPPFKLKFWISSWKFYFVRKKLVSFKYPRLQEIRKFSKISKRHGKKNRLVKKILFNLASEWKVLRAGISLCWKTIISWILWKLGKLFSFIVQQNGFFLLFVYDVHFFRISSVWQYAFIFSAMDISCSRSRNRIAKTSFFIIFSNLLDYSDF